VVFVEVIAVIEGIGKRYYQLKSQENREVSTSYGSGVELTHNPKVTGSNPVPATKEFKDLHRFGVGPFLLVGYFWALFLRSISLTYQR
jgi:hypothetical protein